jgi:methionyl-tRNA synthetase
MTQKFYITTAIAYPNGKPHIGHAYEAVCTDAIARFHRLMGRDVRFLTGTDEHGLKMAQTAEKEDISPQALADRNSQYFNDMCVKLDISNDRFIRTTDDDHKAVCQELWQRMAANLNENGEPDIYLGKYEGWYSVRDEAYFDVEELTTDEAGAKFAPGGAPVVWTVEETYFFRLSRYQQQLRDLSAPGTSFIQPDTRRNEIHSFLKGPLRDLSLSRTSFSWGVPVPGDDRHVMYVWIDALTNYLSGIVDKDSGANFEERVNLWSESEITHVIGKDITRFHTIYWPAFLMSAGIALPKTVFGHGFLLNRGEKMSKSLGNVVDPMELVERFGVDAVRYFFLRKVSFGDDGGYSAEDIIQTYNSDLANSFGNLVQRVFSFIAKNLEGRVPTRRDKNLPGIDADQLLLAAPGLAYTSAMAASSDWKLSEWISAVFDANKYVDTLAPWSLRKTDPVRMEEVLAVLLIVIRNLAIMLQPSAPTSAAHALVLFGYPHGHQVPFDAINDQDWYDRWAASGFIIQPPTPIFPRLEMPKDD